MFQAEHDQGEGWEEVVACVKFHAAQTLNEQLVLQENMIYDFFCQFGLKNQKFISKTKDL